MATFRSVYATHKIYVGDELVEFQNGILEIDDPRLIEGVRRSAMYGLKIFEDGRPPAGLADPEVETDELVDAELSKATQVTRTCKKCGVTFDNLKDFMRHVQSHSVEKQKAATARKKARKAARAKAAAQAAKAKVRRR